MRLLAAPRRWRAGTSHRGRARLPVHRRPQVAHPGAAPGASAKNYAMVEVDARR
jgi:hypothetical protein